MKYEGHSHVRGYAKNCPGCGHWLEDAENIDLSLPVGTGKCLLMALVVGIVVHFILGAAPGVLGGGTALLISLHFATPRDPDYYCFGCRKFWFRSDVKQSQPNV